MAFFRSDGDDCSMYDAFTMKKNKKCECCKKSIYKDEFYLANDGEIVCIKCLINKGDTDNL